jgi:hypothetical protein
MVAMNKTLIDFAHSQIKGQAMNRAQKIEQAAQMFLDVLTHNDHRLTDAVYDSINTLREALDLLEDAEQKWIDEHGTITNFKPIVRSKPYPPKTAEHEALVKRVVSVKPDIDTLDLFKLLTDIRAFLRGE